MAIIYTSQKSKKKSQNTKKKQEDKASWEKLCLSFGITPQKRKSKAKFTPIKIDPLQIINELNADRSLSHYPSPHVIIPRAKPKPQYEGKMAEREAKAQEEIAEKKKRTGILYNKGPYGFISDGIDPKDLGKK